MGRDEHRTDRRGRARLAQTPEYAKTDSKHVEFSEEFADNKQAEARTESARLRRKYRQS